MAADQLLEVVNEADEIIGTAMRSDIHAQGLLHREVHVWLVTPDKQVIFQRRSASKETFPSLLDATAGGHVEMGQSYEQAAIMEVLEETGLNIIPEQLITLCKIYDRASDPVTQTTNHVYRINYAVLFDGDINQLEIEAGDGAGFVNVPLLEIETYEGLVPTLQSPVYAPVWLAIKEL